MEHVRATGRLLSTFTPPFYACGTQRLATFDSFFSRSNCQNRRMNVDEGSSLEPEQRTGGGAREIGDGTASVPACSSCGLFIY